MIIYLNIMWFFNIFYRVKKFVILNMLYSYYYKECLGT